MKQYQVTIEELEDFAHRVYEESCGSYLDLKESACNKFVQEFLENKKESAIYAGPNVDICANSIETKITDSLADVFAGLTGNYRIASSGHILRDEPNVSPRVEDQVREDYSLLNLNYEGNESERF